jgi:hypothetical protein
VSARARGAAGAFVARQYRLAAAEETRWPHTHQIGCCRRPRPADHAGCLAAIIPFLLLAFAVLHFWPRDTERLSAWPIEPPVTALPLGSVYLGGAYFFLRAARSSRWHTVQGGFPPVATFATLTGIATAAHWEKFTHSHVAF